MGRTWRIYHPDLGGRAGDVVRLGATEAHHVHRVLRLRSGTRVRVFDGRGREREAELVVSEGDDVVARLAGDVSARCEPSLEVSLFPALCKPERMEWLLQKVTEIGVSRVHPFPAARSATSPPTSNRLLRWRRIVLEACTQSGRTRLPLLEIREELPFPGSPGPLALLFEPGPGVEPLAAVCPSVPPDSVWLAVGPESGFSAEETSGWAASGWLRVGLGPRTLRTETAALVALALVLNRWGDLGNG